MSEQAQSIISLSLFPPSKGERELRVFGTVSKAHLKGVTVECSY